MQSAAEMLEECIPTALRFLAGEYDDVTANVLPLISEILSTVWNLSSSSMDLTDLFTVQEGKAVFTQLAHDVGEACVFGDFNGHLDRQAQVE